MEGVEGAVPGASAVIVFKDSGGSGGGGFCKCGEHLLVAEGEAPVGVVVSFLLLGGRSAGAGGCFLSQRSRSDWFCDIMWWDGFDPEIWWVLGVCNPVAVQAKRRNVKIFA